MKIDLTNYEAFLLDYAEGNLNAETAAELILFMEQHPELQIDLEDLAEFTLEAEPALDNDFKNLLKKDSNDLKVRFEELCISYYDRSVSADDKKELDFILQQYPQWEKEFEAFEKTYLTIENSMVFTGKDALKKEFNYEGSFEHRAVRAMEGELSLSERTAFEAEIRNNAQLEFYWKAFQAARLVPENFVFQNKKQLYKTAKRGLVLPVWSGYLAVAASVMLVIAIFALVSDGNKNESGISAVKQDSLNLIREVIPYKIKPVVADKNEIIPFTNDDRNSEVILPEVVTEKRISMPELADLKSTSAPQIHQTELERRYMSMSPSDLSVREENPTASNTYKNLSPSQLLIKGARKVLKRKNIEIESPIEEIRENGLAETSIKGLERITRGNVSIKHEPSGKGQRITGFSIGGLGYTHSSGK